MIVTIGARGSSFGLVLGRLLVLVEQLLLGRLLPLDVQLDALLDGDQLGHLGVDGAS